ncbi:hypothetical protein AAFF_G00186520 [Aldrovandia affinis]|uniref:Signal recognition particle receptor subunit beta n=1 Tax=Aldrovandia affinis TaxID=143900 RepID=A0AAD7SXX8_9TELE|nr:hypothetical protein AAFF_G00186520 [Aldrovandia affinis]
MEVEMLAEAYSDSLLKKLQDQDALAIIGLVVAVIVVLLTIVFVKIFWGSKSTRTAVLLVGLCDSGKTLLFSRLLTGNFKRTQTSMTDNSALYRPNNDTGPALTLIDLPGHESLRTLYLEKFKAAARAIVFVVDSAVFQKEVRMNAPTLFIACNKQDITMAKSAKLIQQQLEKELNTLRVTRSAALSAQDGPSGGASVYLGKKGKDFDFSQVPMRVEFLECSARGGKGEEGDADIEHLEKCLVKLP